MSKRAYISRYHLIVKKLQAKPYSSFEEIRDYIEGKMEYLQEQDDSLETRFSIRTFQRDKKELLNLWGIDIEYSKKEKGYFISCDTDSMNFHRMAETFDIYHSLNLASGVMPYVHLEKGPPQSTENLYGLLHAIKNRFEIKFMYQKFWDDEIMKRSVAPYALKEFRNRWYILAKDNKDDKVKSFALDARLSDLSITHNKFDLPADYNVEEHYRHCFGIIGPDDKNPQEIVLSFDWEQGKYIKTLPLHPSQEVLPDGKDGEVQIKLKLCITHDFIMQLLSYGAYMKVIKPNSLANEIKQAHREAFEQY